MTSTQEVFDYLLKEAKNPSYSQANDLYSLAMEGHGCPLSIAVSEFQWLRNVCSDPRIRNCFEVATAFGISALAIGLGLKEREGIPGYLTTMDAYVEEKFNSCDSYRHIKKYLPEEEPDGLRSVNNLIEHFDLAGVVDPVVGWSPDDTDHYISEALETADGFVPYVQFAFIDALHFDESLVKDFDAIWEHIDPDNYFIAIHDRHCFTNALSHIERVTKQKIISPEKLSYPRFGYNMCYVTNMENVDV